MREVFQASQKAYMSTGLPVLRRFGLRLTVIDVQSNPLLRCNSVHPRPLKHAVTPILDARSDVFTPPTTGQAQGTSAAPSMTELR